MYARTYAYLLLPLPLPLALAPPLAPAPALLPPTTTTTTTFQAVVLKFCNNRYILQSEQMAAELARHLGILAVRVQLNAKHPTHTPADHDPTDIILIGCRQAEPECRLSGNI